ncbi:MAG: malonyl-CoA synthase [Pseudorhodoplanes sp.]|nr:malonyl-CoA synthase [Pseudorhodoplanes sp.]
MNLFELIRRAIPSRDKVFLETGAGAAMTYGDMLARSAQLANILVLSGVEPGDRVAAQVEKSAENLLLYLATLRAGAVYLPLNTAYTPAELDYFIGDSEPKLFVCDPAKRAALAPIAEKHGVTALETLDANGKGSLTDAADGAPKDFADVPREDDDLAAILYTSGTTGRSKGAMLTHRNLSSNAQVLVDYWRFTDRDVLLHALPVYHTHGLFVASNTVMLSGGSMIWLSKFDADEVMRHLPRATSMMGVPTFYTRLLKHPGLTREACAHMRLFTSGSAPLLAETHIEFKQRTGHAILERYGMTETNMNTSNPYDGDRIAGTVGFPLPGVELRIADPETGRVLPQGDVGGIEVRGPNVFSGYWRMPEKTKSEFRADGFFITGDVGKIDERGYVHIVGRAKDLIITGGFNVYPKEIESEIDALPGVVESAVIGCPHPDFGEGVTAVVVCKPGATLTEKSIVTELEQRLARFKLPKRVIFVADLPRNSMGKVQKNVLREQNASIYDNAARKQPA